MIQIFLAILILLAMMGFSLIADMKIIGEYVESPVIKIILGPIMLVIGGIICIFVGTLAISPWILFFTGHKALAVLALLIEFVLACFTEIQTTGGSMVGGPIWLRWVFGMAIFWIGGPIMLILGGILASPLLLLIWAL